MRIVCDIYYKNTCHIDFIQSDVFDIFKQYTLQSSLPHLDHVLFTSSDGKQNMLELIMYDLTEDKILPFYYALNAYLEPLYWVDDWEIKKIE